MNLKEHEDILLKVEKAREQLAKLKKQQGELEREKAELEELRRKQDEWSRGRREVADALVKALTILEKEEGEVTRMGELVSNSRSCLSALYDELLAVKEEKWTSATLKEELTKALVILERARKEISKARARIPALDEARPERPGETRPVVGPVSLVKGEGISSLELLRIGFWLALPLAVMLVLIVLIFSTI